MFNHMKKKPMKVYRYADLKKKWLKDPEVKRHYDDLAPAFAVISAIIESRARTGMTQAQLAKKMGTDQSAIARLESGGYNPSIKYLQKVARALGMVLVLQFKRPR
ncbi:MAG: hypothetical protein RLZZ324_1084 [Candidatus Parcubacteria bacterium]|jgi:ribosome-binding protein aMBF1 (putative translation factor)